MIAQHQKLITGRSSGDRLTCIVCPIGCAIRVHASDDGSIDVTGNKCRRGAEYAKEEFNNPTRIVTATCAVAGGESMRLPVRSGAGVAIDDVPAFLSGVYELRLSAPVVRGEIVASDVGQTGIDLVATMSVGRIDE